MIEERDYHHNGKVFELVQQKDCAQCAFFVAKNEPARRWSAPLIALILPPE